MRTELFANCRMPILAQSGFVIFLFLGLALAPSLLAQDVVTESRARAALRIANEQIEYAKTLPPGSEAYIEALGKAELALTNDSLPIFRDSNAQFARELRNTSETLADMASVKMPVEKSDSGVSERVTEAGKKDALDLSSSRVGKAEEPHISQTPRVETKTPKDPGASPTKSNSKWFTFGLAGVFLVMWLLASKLQVNGKLVVFYDYTDLTLTTVGPLLGFTAYLVSSKAGLMPDTTTVLTFVTWALAWLAPLMVAFSLNKIAYLPLVIPVKFTVMIMFVVLYVGAFVLNALLHSTGKGQNEHHMTYKARKRRLDAQSSVAWAEKSETIVAFVSTYIHSNYFLPPSEYLRPRISP